MRIIVIMAIIAAATCGGAAAQGRSDFDRIEVEKQIRSTGTLSDADQLFVVEVGNKAAVAKAFPRGIKHLPASLVPRARYCRDVACREKILYIGKARRRGYVFAIFLLPKEPKQ